MNMPLSIAAARAVASNWITVSDLPFESAFLGGSVAWADADSPYDPASDIDCYLVTKGNPPEGKIGKIRIDGVLLDISWLHWKQLAEAHSDAVLASLLHFGLVVKDDGHLKQLQSSISERFTQPEGIERRLESMRAKIRNGLSGDSSHLPHPEQVMNWLFPATLATHIPLVETCAPLTVRKRFLAAKQVMSPGQYDDLLTLFGFDTVSREQAQSWLDATAGLFDATSEIAETSHRFWATDIRVDAREIAIGGSQHLINSGHHREALYWIIATSARCLTVRADAGIDSAPYLPDFDAMLARLGLKDAGNRVEKGARILEWIEN